MKLVLIPEDGVPPVDGSVLEAATGRLIGGHAGDLPPVEIAMNFPPGRFVTVPGMPGPPGPVGDPGPTGPDGTRWFFDHGPPTVVVGARAGDIYRDLDTGIEYRLD